MSQIDKSKVRKTAEEHVDWFLKTVRPLMLTQFEHGHKHGFEEGYRCGWENAKAERE